MDGYQLKKTLCDIVDYAYSDSPKLRKYKGFYVKVEEKKLRSKHGDYNYATKTIRVFNITKRDDNFLIKTSIHELSHHVDAMNRGRSDHQKPFYEVYKKLLYAGLDMGIFNAENFCHGMRDSSDYNKVMKMIQGYTPAETGYKKEMARVNVHNAYSVKEKLKAEGYSFDQVTKDWYKEVEKGYTGKELRILNNIIEQCSEVSFDVTGALDFSFKRPGAGLIPDSWCGHIFTDEEKEALEREYIIDIKDAWSRKKGKTFSCRLLWKDGKLVPLFDK